MDTEGTALQESALDAAQLAEEIAPPQEQLVRRLSADVRRAAATMGDAEVRFLVAFFYRHQEARIAVGNYTRAANKNNTPHGVPLHFFDQYAMIEEHIKTVLDIYTRHHKMGAWLRSIYGIGPVLSAGLLAHIDIHRAPTVGHIWRFAGLDPTMKWERGQKRPFNASLKVICWKIGHSFRMFSKRPQCYYGQLYARRKALEVSRNESGAYAEVARTKLEQHGARSREGAFAARLWAAGKLTDGHLDLRARRWVVKLFLAHMHAEWYRREFGREPPLPYPIAHLDHAHMIPPPAA